MTRLLRPFVSPDSYRALLYHLSTLVVGSVGLAVLIAGWTVTLVVAITPLVVPLLIGFRIAVGGLAAANGALARELVGSRVRPPVGARATGFWGRGLAVLKDRAFWSQQAHLLASWTVSVVALTPFSLGTQVLAIPFYYRAVDGGVDFFWWSNVDTFAEALLVVPVGLALLVLGVFLLRPLTRVSRALADALLAGEADRVVRPPAQVRARRRRAIASHAAASITVGLLLVAIWALTTAGYFWPVWTLIPLGTLLAGHAWVVFVLEREGIRERRRPLAAHAGVAGVVWLMLVAVWAASGGDYYFWPVWPILGLALTVAVHGVFVHGIARHGERIEVLETTRAGAVNVHEAELRRIERDLHDGAQASLVHLGMNLGMAEQKLQTDPEAAQELLAAARRGAREALDELRDLARGIHPPVLGDRGLEAAVAGLAARSPVHVRLTARLRARPPAAVETAAYFVIAEAVANAGKHADATELDIRLTRENGVLVVEVVDDGRGGADPNGNGMTGLRQRVEALDGSLQVVSPEGGPTTVRARLPCAS